MRAIIILLATIIIALPGCARFKMNHGEVYETIKASPTRNTTIAQKKHAKAVNALESGEVGLAHQWVRESLLADRDFGPAHNTLGKIYYQQEKYYLAAWEFEFANRMMPNRGEPINNLGLVMEAVGQHDRAVEHYQNARTIDEDNPEYLGNLIRARVRLGDEPAALQELLKDFILIDSRREWVDWAKSLLLKAKFSIESDIKKEQELIEQLEKDAPGVLPEPLPKEKLPGTLPTDEPELGPNSSYLVSPMKMPDTESSKGGSPMKTSSRKNATLPSQFDPGK